MRARKVTERHDYGQGYAEEKFGFEIGGRVWWVGIDGYGHNSEQAAGDRVLCHEIINRWNAHEPENPLPTEERGEA